MEDRPIIRLNEEIIGKIAAGEVVESPASAIKELVENSLDAGSTCVTVEIRDGGISHLRVTDNGKGIPSRDVRLAFERHATSKIRKSEDLFDLHTLGFRGEALASIAAVSKLVLTTRHASEETGTRAINEGGVFSLWGYCGDDIAYAGVDPERDQIAVDTALAIYAIRNEGNIYQVSDTYTAHNSDLKNNYSIDYYSKITEIACSDADVEAAWTAFIEEQSPIWEPLLNELNETYYGN